MNNLSMGPVLARVKREVDVASEKYVFRCGVVNCPEVLGVIRPSYFQGRFHFYKRYLLNSEGVYSASRRSAYRFKDEREGRSINRKEGNDLLRRLTEEVAANPTPQGLSDLLDLEEGIQMRREHEKTRRGGCLVYLQDNALPIFVKCARCGRISKIEEASKRHY